MKKQIVVLVLTFLLCFSSGCSKQSDRSEAKKDTAADDVLTKIEDGIQVVYNPKEPSPPAGLPQQIIVTQDLCIGDEEEIEDFIFSQIRNVQVDEEENIYVADSKEVCERCLTKTASISGHSAKRVRGQERFNCSCGCRYLPGTKS